MSLRELAKSDLSFILRDEPDGFGQGITLTTPQGISNEFIGFSNDISQVIDPDTGAIVSGRAASVAINIDSIYAANVALPRSISDTGSKPWLVSFTSIDGEIIKFKVVQSNPDRSLGIITLILELYQC